MSKSSCEDSADQTMSMAQPGVAGTMVSICLECDPPKGSCVGSLVSSVWEVVGTYQEVLGSVGALSSEGIKVVLVDAELVFCYKKLASPSSLGLPALVMRSLS
jgi:hypothetical protein